MRLIMMGTGPFAVPTFEALLDSPHEVAALVTRPARPVHGKRAAPINPMREAAERRGVQVFAPESINTDESRQMLGDLQAELMVVCDYGQILAHGTLACTALGGINLHASLLPKYRGAAPINWAIYNGESETGVTVIHMTPKLDAGPCLVQRRLAIAADDTAVEVEAKLSRLGVPAVLEAMELLASGRASDAPIQDPRQATKAPRLKKEDGLVDWNRSAEAIRNQVRALQPWPKTYTVWQRGSGEPLRLILETVRVESSSSGSEAPGTVLTAGPGRLVVATGQGSLEILQIQPAGKRVMAADDFLRGYGFKPGDRLGSTTILAD